MTDLRIEENQALPITLSATRPTNQDVQPSADETIPEMPLPDTSAQ